MKVNRCFNAREGNPEENIYSKEINQYTVDLRVEVAEGAMCQFSFSGDGKDFKSAGDKFLAKPGRWIDAKVGIYALRDGIINDSGNIDIEWFQIK